MRVRTFLVLTTLLLLASAMAVLLVPNRETLDLPLRTGPYVIPVWGAIVGAMLVGVLFAGILQLTGLGRGAMGRARSLWSTRHREGVRRALENGRHAERDGRLAAAIESYRDALRHSPGDFRATMLLGDALRADGRLAEAIEAHEEARLIQPSSDEPGHALAMDHLAAGDLESARREIRSLADRAAQAAIGPLRRLRDAEARAGSWEQAWATQQMLVAASGRGHLSESDQRQGLGIRTELARGRARGGQPRQAIGTLRKILKEKPEFLPARLLLATLRHEAGASQEARELLVEGFDLTGEPAVLDAVAALDLEREHPEEAISTLRGRVAARRHAESARLALGRLYARLEMLDEAAEQLERVYEDSGSSRLAAYHLARVEQRRGCGDRAATLFRQVLEAGDTPPPGARCGGCRAPMAAWRAACPACGAFGAVTTEWGAVDPPSASSPAEAPAYLVPRS